MVSKADEERKVIWLEPFYELVYVAALIRLGNLLSEDVSLAGFLCFVIVFAPIWWAWRSRSTLPSARAPLAPTRSAVMEMDQPSEGALKSSNPLASW